MLQSEHITGVVVAVGVDADGPLHGILLLGAPGAGKSSTALELIETCPWRRTCLVADDVAEISVDGQVFVARPPELIAGLLELRGFGPAPVRSTSRTALLAGFDLGAEASRLPDPNNMSILGEGLPVWPLAPDRVAAHRIRMILRAILAGQTP